MKARLQRFKGIANHVVIVVALPFQTMHALANPLELTVFHEASWLDIASEGNYRAVEVHNGGGVVGRAPFFISKRVGIPSIGMPMLTHFLSPAVMEGEGSPNGGITDVVAFQDQSFRTSLKDLSDSREFMAFYSRNLDQRGLRSNLNRKVCENLIYACIRFFWQALVESSSPAISFKKPTSEANFSIGCWRWSGVRIIPSEANYLAIGKS